MNNLFQNKIHAVYFILCMYYCIGCSVSDHESNLHGFSFNYLGKKYQIETGTGNFELGYNILGCREKDIVYLQAVDKEQDGVIDEVIIGNCGLEEANRIYQYGINYGYELGLIKQKMFPRKFETNDQLYHYVLKTYVLSTGIVFNRLLIEHKMKLRSNVQLIDMDADGNINRIEEGISTMDELERQYKYVIDKGIIRKQNRVC